MIFTVTSVSFRSDDRKIVASMGPLSSMPSLSGSVVYTRMSGLSSISDGSSAPPARALPWQHTFPPCDSTGFIGSYVNESGLSLDGGFIDRVPLPFCVFAPPSLDRKNVSPSEFLGGHVSVVCHLFIPIV